MRDAVPDCRVFSTEVLEYGTTRRCGQLDAIIARRKQSRSPSIFASVEEIIADARAGRPVILVDSPDRENEGDIVIPAQFACHRMVNFMATHARGLICLAITAERAEYLQLAPMARRNASSFGTAFTVSIEAVEGVTTGISAHDRAVTIAVAIDPEKGPEDVVSPGHVFPLVARPGGVIERPGHTEAAVEIARLAGLTPAGVICEIMNDDGTMARLPDLRRFAARHGIRIGSIEALVSWREQGAGAQVAGAGERAE